MSDQPKTAEEIVAEIQAANRVATQRLLTDLSRREALHRPRHARFGMKDTTEIPGRTPAGQSPDPKTK